MGYDSTFTKLNSVNHNGFNYNFTYDGFGNTVQTKVGDTALITNGYAPNNGLLQFSIYGNTDIRYYTYDNAGRVTGVKNNDTDAYSWTYSGSGVPNSYTDNVSGKKYLYTYDSLGRLIYQSGKNISDNDNQSSSVYKYDISNNLTQITNTAGTLGVSAWYHYDDINRPTASRLNDAVIHTYTYDSVGRLSGSLLHFSNSSVNKNYTYYHAAIRNSAGNTKYQTTQLKTETIGDRGYTYTYDNVGNITAITEKTTASGSYNAKVSYTYNSLGQLTRENNKDLNKTIVYTYDGGGNIKTRKEYAYTTGTVGTATDTVTYTYDSTWKDKLISYDGQSITYDNIGNPLQYRDGMTFTWFGRQMETTNVGNTAISYEYNADGLRTSKTVGNAVHTYEYTGNTLYYENRGGIQLHYRYDVNGNLASITRIDTDGTKFTLYAVCNSRGDVEELRNLSGSLYARYIYDTWGNTIHVYNSNGAEITSTTNLAVQNPIRYRGYYYDAETGFYYLQSRYYDPVTCRFLNADGYVSTGQGILGTNMFSYCANNAVLYVDITGTMHVKGTDACGGSGNNHSLSSVQYEPDDIENDVEKVFKAKYFTFYKGVLVIRHSSDFLTSWAFCGIIFLNHNLDEYYSVEDQTQALNHEYGHILQERELGINNYISMVAIPSMIYNLFSRGNKSLHNNYYNMPWEYDADIRGQVGRTHADWASDMSEWYFAIRRMISL